MKPPVSLTLRSGALVTLMLAACASVLPQSQSRVIEWPKVSTFNSKTFTTPDNHYVDRIDEVEIESVNVEGPTVTFGSTFPASDEWLKNLSFKVKNVSTRKIKQVLDRALEKGNDGGFQALHAGGVQIKGVFHYAGHRFLPFR